MRRGALLLAALAVAGAGAAAEVLDFSGAAAAAGVSAAPTLRALLASKGDACTGEIATGNWCIGVDGTQGCCGGCCGCCDVGCDASPCYACGASNACAGASASSMRPCAPTEAACDAALAEINSAGGCARAVCKKRTQYFSVSGGGRGDPYKTTCYLCGDAPCACYPGCPACQWTDAGKPATCDGAYAEKDAALSSKYNLGDAKT